MRRKPPRDVPQEPHTIHELVAYTVGTALDKRWRIMISTSVVSAVLASLVVAIPLTKIQNDDTASFARANSIRNCHIAKDIGITLDTFVTSDANDRQEQLTTAQREKIIQDFGKLLGKKFIIKLTEHQRAVDRDTIHFWRGWVHDQLIHLASPDCQAVLAK